MNRMLRLAGAGLVLALAAGPAGAVEPDAPRDLITPADVVAANIQKMLKVRLRTRSVLMKRDRKAVKKFYAGRGYQPVWVNNQGPTRRARQIMTEIRRADDYGLKASDYSLQLVGMEMGIANYPALRLAADEIHLSHAVLAYARHARAGRVMPAALSKDLTHKPELPKPMEVLERASSGDDPAGYLASMHPVSPEFLGLKKKLTEYRRVAAKGSQLTIPGGKTLKPGMRHSQVRLLRARLGLSAPVNAADSAFSEDVYDSQLEAAVRSFQRRHGLNDEGIVGRLTRKALNAPLDKRINQILANMERWRWMPRDLGGTYVRVNLPEYKLRVVRNGQIIHADKVIIGKTNHKTPVFSDTMETVVFNPYWNVPKSITIKELLPQIRRDPDILRRRNLEVLATKDRIRRQLRNPKQPINPHRIDWQAVDPADFPFRLRQPPGRGNALGTVKFLFPNKHAVYMHDTPTKHLFAQSRRMFSHGCVRVNRPRKFAEIILGMDRGWPESKIDQAIGAGKRRIVALKKKIPVHLSYFTAWVSEDGKLHFRDDIYGHDGRLEAALRL